MQEDQEELYEIDEIPLSPRTPPPEVFLLEELNGQHEEHPLPKHNKYNVSAKEVQLPAAARDPIDRKPPASVVSFFKLEKVQPEANGELPSVSVGDDLLETEYGACFLFDEEKPKAASCPVLHHVADFDLDREEEANKRQTSHERQGTAIPKPRFSPQVNSFMGTSFPLLNTRTPAPKDQNTKEKEEVALYGTRPVPKSNLKNTI